MEGPMKNLFDPAGKVALVTGGTSGLGHAIAEAFLQNGVDVAVCSRHPESAPELAELAAAEGRRYLPVYCDITKEEDVEKMGDIIEKELGPVTMLVNSAGMNILKHAEDYDAESFNKVMSLNVLGTHNVSKMCGKRWMIPAHKGRIVNLSSARRFWVPTATTPPTAPVRVPSICTPPSWPVSGPSSASRSTPLRRLSS